MSHEVETCNCARCEYLQEVELFHEEPSESLESVPYCGDCLIPINECTHKGAK